jgi:hypothetical protein
VLTSVVQVPAAQGAAPITKPASAETNVTDPGSKAAGTGDPVEIGVDAACELEGGGDDVAPCVADDAGTGEVGLVAAPADAVDGGTDELLGVCRVLEQAVTASAPQTNDTAIRAADERTIACRGVMATSRSRAAFDAATTG